MAPIKTVTPCCVLNLCGREIIGLYDMNTEALSEALLVIHLGSGHSRASYLVKQESAKVSLKFLQDLSPTLLLSPFLLFPLFL